jgi:hypothetical protein
MNRSAIPSGTSCGCVPRACRDEPRHQKLPPGEIETRPAMTMAPATGAQDRSRLGAPHPSAARSIRGTRRCGRLRDRAALGCGAPGGLNDDQGHLTPHPVDEPTARGTDATARARLRTCRHEPPARSLTRPASGASRPSCPRTSSMPASAFPNRQAIERRDAAARTTHPFLASQRSDRTDAATLTPGWPGYPDRCRPRPAALPDET